MLAYVIVYTVSFMLQYYLVRSYTVLYYSGYFVLHNLI